jgi:uncharacterized membrane protein (DUF106 family)
MEYRSDVHMQALQKEIEEATKTKQAELLAELEEEHLKTEQQMLKIQEDLDKLKQQQMGVGTGSVLRTIFQWLSTCKVRVGEFFNECKCCLLVCWA